MVRPGCICASIGAAASLLSGGCANATLPSLPDLAEAMSVSQDEVVGSPTEVYARVARGAMSCWFESGGPLKANYVYHAEAEPASKGGKSEIVIHERDRQSQNQKGLRAFRVAIAPNGDSATLSIENLKLQEPLAASMDRDVRRWAAGAIGCEEGKEQWSPRPPEPEADTDTWRVPAPDGHRT